MLKTRTKVERTRWAAPGRDALEKFPHRRNLSKDVC